MREERSMPWQIEVLDGIDTGKKAGFINGVATIGRDEKQCNLILNDDQVSRFHARIKLHEDGTVSIEDLGSSNGTLVNERRISSAVIIAPEDKIQLGNSVLGLARTSDYAVKPDEVRRAQAVISIGRDPANDLVIEDHRVSRKHARLEQYQDGFYVTDLGSTQGTLIDGRQISGPVKLETGSWLQICGYNYYIEGNHLRDEQGNDVAWFNRQILQPGQLFNLQQVLLIPFSGRNSLKWLLGSLLTFIPVISFLADGYRYRLFQSGQQGTMEMPEWDNWGELFVKGLLFFLIASVYFLAPALYMTLALTAALRSPNLTTSLLVAAATPAILLNLCAGFILPMSWAHYAATGKFVDAFYLRSIIRDIGDVLGDYIKLYLVILLLGLCIALLYTIPILGILLGLLGTFYIYIVASLLFGQLYRLSLNKVKTG